MDGETETTQGLHATDDSAGYEAACQRVLSDDRSVPAANAEQGETQLDLSTWPRRDIYKCFSNCDYPFYSVTIPIDVTQVKKAARAWGLSFYHLMIWLCTKAVNSVPEFLLRIRGRNIVQLKQTSPSFTSLKPGAESFQIITVPWEEDVHVFCREAKACAESQTVFVQQEKETDCLIYFSCTPWFDFTALTNEHTFDKDDTIPRIAWGKYYEERGRLWVHMSIEVNHRTIDGFHIGQLKEAIDSEIARLI